MTAWTDFLLQENGSFLFQENGFKIVLEQSAIAPTVIPPVVKLSAGWFAIPRMREKILGREKIYLKEEFNNIRNG